jgi:hypothetical protein
MKEHMTEQELVLVFKKKVEEINAAVRQMADVGIYVDFELTNYQQIQWEREICHIHAIVNKVL